MTLLDMKINWISCTNTFPTLAVEDEANINRQIHRVVRRPIIFLFQDQELPDHGPLNR